MREDALEILTDIERVRENLLRVSNEIWLSIDHNDLNALEEGVAFKRKFTHAMTEFNTATSELSLLIREHIDNAYEPRLYQRSVSRFPDRGHSNGPNTHPGGVVFSLDDSFTHMKPVGYEFRGEVITGLESWRELYLRLCQQLKSLDRARFDSLVDAIPSHSRKGRPIFSLDTKLYLVPMDVGFGVYTEGNMSANSIRDRIRLLFDQFGIETTDLSIRVRPF